MKKKILKMLVYLLMMMALLNPTQAQQEVKGTKQTINISIDKSGNAEMVLKMKLNAQQWENFKKIYGNNPSSLKRDIIKGMPTVYFTDFKYNEDAMDRSYELNMKALAAAKVDKKGKWRTELDMEDPDITKLNDREFRLNLNMTSNGAFVEQVQMIKLPAVAKNAKIEKDSFGKAVLTYETGQGWLQMGIKIIGILLVLVGAGLALMNMRGKQG